MTNHNTYISRIVMMLTLMITMGVGSAWGDTWDGTTKTAPDMSTNKGTSEALAIQISTAAELAWLGDQMKAGNTANGKTYGNKYWKLMADIDLGGNSTFTGKDWASMIGHTGNAFCGYFDGNNKTVSNIQVAAVTSTKYYGLFPSIQGKSTTDLSTVHDLKVSGVFIKSTVSCAANTRIGGLAGYVKQANITNVSVSNVTFTYTNTITGTNQLGGAIGCMENNTTLTNVDVTGVSATFSNTTTGLYVGGIVGASTGTANTNSMTGCDVTTISVTHTSNITGTTHLGGLAGQANTSLNVVNTNTVNGFTVNVSSGTGSAKTLYAGGLFGYCKGTGQEIKGNSASNVSITTASTVNDVRLAGFIGSADGTGGLVSVKGNTASTVSITSNGTTAGTNYLGGFIAYTKGKSSPNERVLILGNTVTSPTVTMNGVVGHGFYMGGFLGYADAHTNLYNNKVATPAITISNTINAATYVGGAVGFQANYTTIDGMTVTDGSITGPSENKNVKNNVVFFVGGFIGQQNSSGTAAYQPNKFMNVAVSDMTINLGKYVPAAQIQNHKFSVGGIAGSVNAPNKDVNGFSGMPENLVSTGVKIYAPYAATSPTVALFGTGAPAHNNLTADVAATALDGLDRSKSDTWLYSNYKLGLSPEFLASGNVIANDAEPALNKYRKNYTATPTPEDGISYLSVTDETFKKTNRYLDTERDSKTVLWWTNSNNYAATGPTTTNFTTYEQPIYPNGATAAQVAQLTSLPYYMYFFQGVSNAKYTSQADAEKIVEGIEANVAEAAKAEPLTLTITNTNEGQRGFGNQTFSVEASSSVDSYQWYVDGKAAGTATTQTVAPDWKFGRSIVVNAIKGGNIVASASYAMPIGVLKTKNSSEKIRSDINGRGTKANPYIIDGEAALRQWSYLSTYSNSLFFETMDKLYNDGKNTYAYHPMYHYNRAYYVLEADIDLGGKEFTPISHMGYSASGTDGTYSQNYIFQGNFEGNGHTISNFNITWKAGQYNGNDANSYYGFFGAVGGPTAVAKWGDSGTSNTVVQDLVIDKATLKHDVKNTTFAYKTHTHIVSTNTSNCMVGVLAGVVAANTTVQNIEIRDSKITDSGSNDYSLATRGLFVGGAIGSVQSAYNKTELPANNIIKNIVVGTDIDLTHAMIQDLAFAQQGAYNVGGIIGRFASTNGNLASTQAVMPKYLLYIGSIKACYTAANGKKDALISPVIAATRYSSNQGISDKNISKIWEGNNNDKEQLTVADALYYNFKISDASGTMHLVTEDYPNKVCKNGARAQDTHTDGNETAAGYLGQRYQGVNYNAIFCDAATYGDDADGGKRMAVAILNSHSDVDVYWEWPSKDATPHMTNTPTVGAYIVRDAETADKYNVVGTAVTAGKYYKWYVGGVLQDEHSSSITVPADISDSNIKAEVYESSAAGSPVIATTQYLVIKGEFKVNTSISKDGDTYTVGLTRGGVDLTTNTLGDRIAVTYQWYKGNAVNVNTAELLTGETTNTITIDKATLGEVNNLFCHVIITTTGADPKELFKGDISHYVREANVVYLQLQDTFTDSKGVIHNKPTTSGVGSVTDPVTSWANAYAKLNDYTVPTKEYVEGHGGTWTSATNFDDETYYLAHKDEYLYDTYKRDGNKRKVKPIEECTNNWDNNIIVLMGLSTDGYFNTGETDQHAKDGVRANKPVTITGQWDGTNYYGYLSNLSGDFSINADHKFENMGIGVLDKGIGASESVRYRIYAHRWNVHAGKGLLMGWAAALEWGSSVVPVTDANKKIYKITSADVSTGTPVGKYACDIAIMGGYLNDNTSDNPEMFEYINHGRDDIGQQIKIESGFWGPVCPGNRQTDSGNTITTYYTMGGPDHPAKTTITVDIDREWNDTGRRNQFNSAMSPATVDVGCILTGNHEGTMYADVTLNILSGNMGRIVNGIKGAQRRQIKKTDSFTTGDVYRHTVKYGDTWTPIAAPAPDSYFGRGILNFDPRRSDNNTSIDPEVGINKRVSVVELYCGGLGRGHNDGSYHPEVRSYFYGLSEVNIKGGTFQKTIYGSGAGGTNGIGTETNHTDDDGLPYWKNSDGRAHVWYAPYEYAKANGEFVKVKITGTGSDDENLEGGYVNLEKTRNIINITGGIFGSEEKPVSIYAGGNGETDAALVNPSKTTVGDVKNTYNTPNHQAGNMYGAADGLTTQINISGDAKIYGSIYGGGKGSMRYYRFFLRAPNDVVAYTADNQEYTRIWSPKRTSNGDYNTNGGADWQNIINSRKNADRYLDLGQVYGNTKVTISGNVEIRGNVYGGGEGVSDITVDELFSEADSEFGLANQLGEKSTIIAYAGTATNSKRSAHVDWAKDTFVNFPGMGKIFGNAGVEISGNVTIHGNVYGGGKAGAIQGTTNVDVKGNVNIFGKIYGAGQGLTVDKSKDYTKVANIDGNTQVTLGENAYVWQDIFAGGQNAVVEGNTLLNMEGGHIAANVFGGGEGTIVGENITSADIYGNTTVNITEGDIVWDRTSLPTAMSSSITIYTYSKTTSGTTHTNVTYTTSDSGATQESVKLELEGEGNTNVTVSAGPTERTVNETTVYDFTVTYTTPAVVESEEVLSTNTTRISELTTAGYTQTAERTETTGLAKGEIVYWDPDNQSLADNTIRDGKKYYNSLFYDSVNKKFLILHNVFGGGNIACRVGHYDNEGALEVLTDDDGNSIPNGVATVSIIKGLFGVDLITKKQWKDCYNDNRNPHFYVFGGGLGEKTKVGNTNVTVNIEGEYGEYTAEVDGDSDEQLAKPMRKRAKSRAGGDLPVAPVFDNSKGIPNFTVLGVLGGGYAGLVAGNTKVTVDGKTFLHRVYGGGFGDPNSSANNTTGQVGGNTEVYVNGAHTYGDVFGGGAGVASKTVDLNNVARVLGTTSVTVADDARIYGAVYGGGDMACVGSSATNTRAYATSVSSASSKSSDIWTYAHSNHQTFVNILGGDIFGEVYGGGKGVKKAAAHDYTMVGRVEGNTLLHIASSVTDDDGQTWKVAPEATVGAKAPYVWNRIYGGCAYGIVDGNTMVHVEGGMLGLNIFGGGYGDMTIENDQTDPTSGASTASSTLDQVLGKLDTSDATFANVLGNTKVQIDGGSWIWNQRADINGNITTWLDASKKVVNDLDGFKALVVQIQNAKTLEELRQIEAVKSINENFFKIDTKQFSKNHNIFGGGNRACFVGTYSDTDASSAVAPADDTGTAEVIINHSPIVKIKDVDGNEIDMLDHTTAAGLCWYLGINNIAHPQFSVFGAGYGANTKVANTIVKAQPGVQLNGEGSLIYPENPKYLNEESDLMAYYDFDLKIAEAWENVSLEDRRKYYGLTGDNEGNTFLRYRSSHLAWSMGSPNFTFMDIHGGGFSGYVVNDAYVEADCQLTVRNIFGAGLGSKPYGTVTDQASADLSTLGQVGRDASVFFKSGIVSLNVYGGGAGVESKYLKDGKLYDVAVENGTLVDFPNIARVKGKTNVDVYGESIKMPNPFSFAPALAGKRFERTVIFGSVYGGGDVAIVGNSAAAPAVLTGAETNYTTTVSVRGGSMQAQIYAGGKGRLADQCSIDKTDPANPVYGYKKLGAVYGNARLIVDHADWKYPYTANPKVADTGVSSHIWNRIYGGCENGTVYGNTLVEVNDGSLGHNVFGGGFGDDGTGSGHSAGDNDEPETPSLAAMGRAAATITSADVTGNTNIFVRGGEMELTSYWHPDTRTWEPATIVGSTIYSPQYNPKDRKFKINHNIYGGGNLACRVEGNSYITMSKGMLKKTTAVLPGQATDGDYNFFTTNEWYEVYTKVGSPHFSVFGGGYGENTYVANSNLNLRLGETIDPGIGNLVAGDDYKHFVSEQSVMDIIGGGYSGKIEGSNPTTDGVTHVNVSHHSFARRIFGGGFYNSARQTNVTITSGDCHDVFGGGLLGDITEATHVNIGSEAPGADNSGIFIHGNIYGGNDVSGYINLVDKAGDGKDVEFVDNETTEPVDDNDYNNGTHIKIRGGHIFGNVYGAGNGDYRYALGKNGETQVTVNEHYKLEGTSNEYDLVYTVPMRSTMISSQSASPAMTIVNINSWRPLTNKVTIDLAGTGPAENKQLLRIDGNVYGGGNSATVLTARDGEDSPNYVGGVKFRIGNHMRIGGVYLGSDGDQLFVNASENPFLQDFQDINSLSLHDEINWKDDPSNHGISTAYLPTAHDKRPLIYPHLLDLYFQPVEMAVQPKVLWNGSTTGNVNNVTIGTFCCGGNRGNMNVAPETNGNIVDITFPTGLIITDKIIGGCNRANYTYNNTTTGETTVHTGGYLLGKSGTTKPLIKLTVLNQFQPKAQDGKYVGANVYGGCYETGSIKGDVKIDFRSNMLNGLDKAKLLASNNTGVATCNVYGAGYGMESYVVGDVNLLFGNECKPAAAKSSTPGSGQSALAKPRKDAPSPETFNEPNVSANFVYGGGQQGNVIGNTTVKILNGHVNKSVTGGSYSGYQYGSTQVLVGYPKYYVCKTSGEYNLKRTDQATDNLALKNKDAGGNETGFAIKQTINLLKGDIVSEQVYDAIVAHTAGNSSKFAPTTENPSTYGLTWNDIDINIGEAIYGGGYSLSSGSSVAAGNTTVLKYTNNYNVNDNLEASELSAIGGTTVGYGGNTTMLIADHPAENEEGYDAYQDKEHITVSSQVMLTAALADDTDLYGYYYKGTDDKYHYIYQAGTYFKGTKMPEDAVGSDVYMFDAEGGIFGDGHLSYAEGFRNAEITGYGYAQHTVAAPKYINTFQRMDMLRLTDNCFTLLGARDYTVNEISSTPYSVARVGEIQMISSINAETNSLTANNTPRERNFMGFSNNIHYIGAVYSNVGFDHMWHNASGTLGASGDNFTPVDGGDAITMEGKSYKQVKEAYITDYYQADKKTIKTNASSINFQQRNDGTAKNMIGIASGYALKIQNIYETYADNKMVENIYYGPIHGVIEMNLIDVREDEGGGYVYADNLHHRTAVDGSDEDFLETTGNFVFPYNPSDGRHVVDDCFPSGYDQAVSHSKTPEQNADIHYWYVTGYNYFYNAHITGYTYNTRDAGITFDLNNADGLMQLSGAKAGQTPSIYSITWRSGHENSYQCDLEKRNADNSEAVDASGQRIVTDGTYTAEEAAAENRAHQIKDSTGKYPGETGYEETYPQGYTKVVENGAKKVHGYTLGISAAQYGKYSENESAWYHLPFSSMKSKENEEILMQGSIPQALTADANIGIRLFDHVDNSGSQYYQDHLSKPCEATIILTLPAMEDNGTTPKLGYIGIQYFYEIESGSGNTAVYKKTTDTSISTASESIPGKQYYYYNSVLNRYSPITDLRLMFEKSGSEYVAVAGNTMDLTTNKTYYYKTQREYTYTIYLTIDYVEGPGVQGNITINNCALPGELIKLSTENIVIDGADRIPPTGSYWRIGRLNAEGDEFQDTTPWTITSNTNLGYDTYKQGDNSTRNGVFVGCDYNTTENALYVPAYYFMNGYGVQYGFSVRLNGQDILVQVPMRKLDGVITDTLVVHNYHMMDPHYESAGFNLHLAQAIARAKEFKDYKADKAAYDAKPEGEEPKAVEPFAEPRIYISDEKDMTAFTSFLDSIGNNNLRVGKEYVKIGTKTLLVPRYGESAQFVLQNNLAVPQSWTGASRTFVGTFHGNGHVLTGLANDAAFLGTNNGHIYNLGLASGKIANSNEAMAGYAAGKYHCCFEYNDGSQNPRKVYRMDGSCEAGYTPDDFRYGKVAYDLNQYYLDKRYVLGAQGAEPAPVSAAAKYVEDYYANGDYQYARRRDADTKQTTGINYLRTGTAEAPGYGTIDTHHDTSHAIDKARAQGYVPAHDAIEEVSHLATEADVTAGKATNVGDKVIDTPASPATPESRTGNYLPLFNATQQTEGDFGLTEQMNDYLFWGQSLQQSPETYPTTIESHQNSIMTNRVWRAVGYHGDASPTAYLYNAYNYNEKSMATYVHYPSTTAVDFTCAADGDSPTYSVTGQCFYPPFNDVAPLYSLFEKNTSNRITRNLLVYTLADDGEKANEAYDVVKTRLGYDQNTSEANIQGHHVVAKSANYLHLVERTYQNEDATGATCLNNDFHCPIAFTVTDRAWYTRRPRGYAELNSASWEGLCLPFAVNHVQASHNGEISHFYGATHNGADTGANGKDETNIGHEYWLRGMTSVEKDDKDVVTANFSRPGDSGPNGCFSAGEAAVKGTYTYHNTIFPDTYKSYGYVSSGINGGRYERERTFDDYQFQASNTPYIVAFPGSAFCEFDLSGKWSKNKIAKDVQQTVTFNYYVDDSRLSSHVTYATTLGTNSNVNASTHILTIPVTPAEIKTEKELAGDAGKTYSHIGIFAAKTDVSGIDEIHGSEFEAAGSVVLPFRTYMTIPAAGGAKRSVIIGAGNMSLDQPDIEFGDPETGEGIGAHLAIYSVNHDLVIESTYAVTLNVHTVTGHLNRTINVQPGKSRYTDFPPGVYIVNGQKLVIR